MYTKDGSAYVGQCRIVRRRSFVLLFACPFFPLHFFPFCRRPFIFPWTILPQFVLIFIEPFRLRALVSALSLSLALSFRRIVHRDSRVCMCVGGCETRRLPSPLSLRPVLFRKNETKSDTKKSQKKKRWQIEIKTCLALTQQVSRLTIICPFIWAKRGSGGSSAIRHRCCLSCVDFFFFFGFGAHRENVSWTVLASCRSLGRMALRKRRTGIKNRMPLEQNG